jgi:hypothetical protein
MRIAPQGRVRERVRCRLNERTRPNLASAASNKEDETWHEAWADSPHRMFKVTSPV